MKDVAPTHRLVEKFNDRQNGKAPRYSVTWDAYYDYPAVINLNLIHVKDADGFFLFVL